MESFAEPNPNPGELILLAGHRLLHGNIGVTRQSETVHCQCDDVDPVVALSLSPSLSVTCELIAMAVSGSHDTFIHLLFP